MRFMIDNHTLEVISMDFVPIVPYNTTNLSIGLGQRYDVIVQAKEETSGNFWLRAIPQESCSDNDSGRSCYWSDDNKKSHADSPPLL